LLGLRRGMRRGWHNLEGALSCCPLQA
jgi:hypothetical protein